ncbi:SDR family oxidoreductase [Alphaproteobacteria bacterium]|nr:SDR family oxidoreductase [Alphaproteobacteria bacterium]
MNLNKLENSHLFCLKNKVTIIAGASKGIGLAISKGFKQNGAFVIGLSRRKSNSNFFDLYFECDVTNKNDLREVIKILKNKNIFLDVLVYSAGISNLKDKDETKFEKLINTNLIGNFLFINVLKKLINNNSSIINISSINAKLGFPDNPGYVASKGGVEALTRSLAIDLAKKNIRVNCIRPGYIKTQMTKKSYNNQFTKKIRINKTILKRWGETEDIVGSAIFLSSKASSFITGSVITVDGGWIAKGLDELEL